jgi:hypothetical protein
VVITQPEHTRNNGGSGVSGRITTKTNFTTAVELLLHERLELSPDKYAVSMILLSAQQAYDLSATPTHAQNDVFQKIIHMNEKLAVFYLMFGLY